MQPLGAIVAGLGGVVAPHKRADDVPGELKFVFDDQDAHGAGAVIGGLRGAGYLATSTEETRRIAVSGEPLGGAWRVNCSMLM